MFSRLRDRRPRSTVWFRLTAWYAAFFVIGSAAVFALAYLLLASSLHRQDRDRIEAKLREVTAEYEVGGLEAVKRKMSFEERPARRHPFLVRVAGPDNDTRLIATRHQWADFDLTRLAAPASTGRARWVSIPARDDEAVLEVVSIRAPDRVILQVGASTERRDTVLERFAGVVVASLIPIGLIGVGGGAYLATRALRPLRDLIQTVRAIDSGSMDARVTVRGTRDELDELGGLFNAMLERIAALVRGMRGALDTVAHDLRTPMARLRGIAEGALRAEIDTAGNRNALADCVEESDRVLTLLDTLMDVSEAQTGALTLDLEPVDVRSLLDDTVELYRDIAEDKAIRVQLTAPREVYLRGDRNRMRQVMANVLDNAIKYTHRGGRVDITAYAEHDRVVIVLEDDGIGMAPQDLPRIWERLYRGPQSRAQRGLGLGLSLVKAVVHAHHGSVQVWSEPGKGARFTLSLPRVSHLS
jgi:signal transduction histidine kinase